MPRQRFALVPLDPTFPVRYIGYAEAAGLVDRGLARWRQGGRSLQELTPVGRQWRPCDSGGYTVLQLVRQ